MMDTYCLEPLDCAAPLSGVEICEDLAQSLIEGLKTNADLQPANAYNGYAAKITVELQLVDIDSITLSQTVAVGTLNPETPVTTVEIDVSPAGADEIRERSGLAAPDYTKEGSALPAKPKRWYTPRNASK